MLKLATADDRDDYLKLARSFYEKTPFYPTVTWSEEKALMILDLAILTNHTDALVLFYLEDSKPVGMLVGFVSSTPFSDDLIASELAWYIEPEFRGSKKAVELVYAYEAWARKVGCTHASMSLLTTLTDASSFYERVGYTKTEISFLKVL